MKYICKVDKAAFCSHVNMVSGRFPCGASIFLKRLPSVHSTLPWRVLLGWEYAFKKKSKEVSFVTRMAGECFMATRLRSLMRGMEDKQGVTVLGVSYGAAVFTRIVASFIGVSFVLERRA